MEDIFPRIVLFITDLMCRKKDHNESEFGQNKHIILFAFLLSLFHKLAPSCTLEAASNTRSFILLFYYVFLFMLRNILQSPISKLLKGTCIVWTCFYTKSIFDKQRECLYHEENFSIRKCLWRYFINLAYACIDSRTILCDILI
jgi:hypothetical protein